jgi:Mor family transcriptional regulator
MTPLDIRHTDLPPALREVAALIGLEATLLLVETWGGVRLYLPFPRNLDVDHPLVRVLGWSAAERLCQGFGSGVYTVPRGLEALRAARDRAIRAERDQGRSARALALKYGLSERRLWEILAAEETPGRDARAARASGQMALF